MVFWMVGLLLGSGPTVWEMTNFLGVTCKRFGFMYKGTNVELPNCVSPRVARDSMASSVGVDSKVTVDCVVGASSIKHLKLHRQKQPNSFSMNSER